MDHSLYSYFITMNYDPSTINSLLPLPLKKILHQLAAFSFADTAGDHCFGMGYFLVDAAEPEFVIIGPKNDLTYLEPV